MFTDKQKHFIGHTTPITCFDVSSDGLFIASCQDGSTTSHICPKEKEDCTNDAFCSLEC